VDILSCLILLLRRIVDYRVCLPRYPTHVDPIFKLSIRDRYGDLVPRSNIGKPFFVVWSLIAVPIITILIQKLSPTIISTLNKLVFILADLVMWTERDVGKFLVKQYITLKGIAQHIFIHNKQKTHDENDMEMQGQGVETTDNIGNSQAVVLSTTSNHDSRRGAAGEGDPPPETEHHLAHQITAAIKDVVVDIHSEPKKRYTYEQWQHFRKLILFSQHTIDEIELLKSSHLQPGEDIVEWDWIGDNSPMLADITEAEWVLHRLCESLSRYSRRQTGNVS